MLIAVDSVDMLEKSKALFSENQNQSVASCCRLLISLDSVDKVFKVSRLLEVVSVAIVDR